jgi:hypothetical protein
MQRQADNIEPGHRLLRMRITASQHLPSSESWSATCFVVGKRGAVPDFERLRAARV